MSQVFKESEYYSNTQETQEESLPAWETYLLGGIEGLRSDFSEVAEASRNFPIRSALTVIGFISVLYIGFRITKTFAKIVK